MSNSGKQFQQLTTPWRDRLFSVAVRQADSRQKAEDWVQESMLKAWKHFSDLKESETVYAWLLKILHSVIVDDVRRESRRAKLAPVVCVEDEELQKHSSSSAGPFEEVLQQQNHDRISNAISALPCEFREVLLFRDVEGLSYQEISEILDIPKGTVMSRLSRARRMLSSALIKSSDHSSTHVRTESAGGFT
ncbi:RNA polymerase sigma factor [Endozoicomonas arenosclerae]|uniref:RNA polymerase sigma factor n=1 Tax=Endozoicomonas arenosclerae TaxID=1633495 RepID=UPI000785A8B0|nr:sigma-70 family RNA polymerase sigma factor [Endozoicomonas arenosclerae]